MLIISLLGLIMILNIIYIIHVLSTNKHSCINASINLMSTYKLMTVFGTHIYYIYIVSANFHYNWYFIIIITKFSSSVHKGPCKDQPLYVHHNEIAIMQNQWGLAS